MYGYAANNPVRYTDPDGQRLFLDVLKEVAKDFWDGLKPNPKPFNTEGLYARLEATYYDDCRNTGALSIQGKNSVSRRKAVKLESHPVAAIGNAMPRGMYAEGNYENPNQKIGEAVKTTGTIIDAIGLTLDIVTGLQDEDGHSIGDVNFVCNVTGGKATSWFIVRTGINGLTGENMQQVMTREQAFDYLKDNEQRLIKDGKFKEILRYID